RLARSRSSTSCPAASPRCRVGAPTILRYAGTPAVVVCRRGAAQPADRGARSRPGAARHSDPGTRGAGTARRGARHGTPDRPRGGTALGPPAGHRRPEQLDDLVTGRGRPTLVVAAGPGWDPDALLPDVAVPESLLAAAGLLAAAVG